MFTVFQIFYTFENVPNNKRQLLLEFLKKDLKVFSLLKIAELSSGMTSTLYKECH